MKCKIPVILEAVMIRGIEGFIADEYLQRIAQGEFGLGLIGDYDEAHNMAVQVFFQWRGLGLK